MSKRLLLYLAVLVLLLAVALSADRGDKDTELLQQYSVEVTAFLADQERDARAWVQQVRPQLETVASAPRHGAAAGADWSAVLREQVERQYTVLVHRGDSVLFWSSNRALPPAAVLKALAGQSAAGHSLQQLPYGYYAAVTEPFSGDLQLSILIPIRYTLAASPAEAQAPVFPASASIPGQVVVSSEQTPYPVRAGEQALCYLAQTAPLYDALFQWVKLLCLGLALALFLALVRQGAQWLGARVHPLAGWSAVFGTVVALIVVNLQFGVATHFVGGLPVFAQRFAPPTWLAHSLGDWIVHLALIAWALVYAPRSVAPEPATPENRVKRLALGAGYYAAFTLTLLFAAEAMRQLIGPAGLNLDFNNILNLDALDLAGLGGLAVLMTGLFLFGNRLLIRVRELELSMADRAIGLGVGLIALVAGYSVLGGEPGLSVAVVGALGLLYAAAFTVFTTGERPDFGWIVSWLLVYSIFSAYALSRYNAENERAQRLAYAEALAVERDTSGAEPALARFAQTLRADSAAIDRLLKPWPFKPLTAEVRDHLNEWLYRENYLFQHYRLNVYVFDRERLPLLREQERTYAQIAGEHWEKARELPGLPGVRYENTADGKFQYLLRLRAFRMGDPTQPAELYVILEHEYPRPTRVYAHLFYNTPYKQLAQLARYDFAVQRHGQLVAEQGQGVAAGLAAEAPAGQVRDLDGQSGRLDAVYKTAEGTTAVVGRAEGGWYKPLYLFSLLFSLYSLLLIALAFANAWLRFLPDELLLQFSTRGSLAKRIHYWSVVLVGLAFFAIGFLTYRHFTRAAGEAERANLDYRAEAVMTHLRTELVNPALSADSLRRALPRSLATLASSLNMDVNLYGADGSLVFTTREELGALGVLPGKMNPYALAELQRTAAEPRLTLAESVAGKEFYTQYVALRNGQQQLFGYLGIPSQFTERHIGPEVSDFIGMLASLYIFLLLIAYVATFVLARSIIRPVTMISDKIRELRLEDRNQPLEYAGDAQDELSELVADYNRMVDTLEASKVKMIRLEREGAWREMARQVAHDIKNPLTTMKLSMQQLERVSSNPEQAAAYLRKAITRLIEQIDSLAQIASEFSMFANLDIQEKHRHDMVLNDVVESVYDLFSEQKNVTLDLKLPENDRYHIRGDKNHLIRVFNNLIINAIQAIPSDRSGAIRVSLHRKGDLGVVQISDNGGGIPAEIQARVFEPNFTTKTSGSGLGLAICRKIIEQHDGTIRFETREGDGTDFFIELPITAVETAEKAAGVKEARE